MAVRCRHCGALAIGYAGLSSLQFISSRWSVVVGGGRESVSLAGDWRRSTGSQRAGRRRPGRTPALQRVPRRRLTAPAPPETETARP